MTNLAVFSKTSHLSERAIWTWHQFVEYAKTSKEQLGYKLDDVEKSIQNAL